MSMYPVLPQEADERALADRCLPLLKKGPLSTLEIRARLGEDGPDTSAIYRALAKDDRVTGKPWGTVTAFELVKR